MRRGLLYPNSVSCYSIYELWVPRESLFLGHSCCWNILIENCWLDQDFMIRSSDHSLRRIFGPKLEKGNWITRQINLWSILLLIHWHYSSMRAFLHHNGPPPYPFIPWLLLPIHPFHQTFPRLHFWFSNLEDQVPYL